MQVLLKLFMAYPISGMEAVDVISRNFRHNLVDP